MSRAKLLYVYCCEGVGALGYERAGFDVYGVDMFAEHSQRRFRGPSHKGDAILSLATLLAGEALLFTHPNGDLEHLTLTDFAALHGSPPCQHATAGTRSARKNGKAYPALIEPTRWLFQQTGLPWVIENVKGAALRDPILLCGTHFDLTATDEDGMRLHLQRHRLFESSAPLYAAPCVHPDGVQWAGVYGGSRRAVMREDETLAQVAPRDRHAARHDRHGGYVPRSRAVRQALMGGVDWTTDKGLSQAIPPAYTEYVGRQLFLSDLATIADLSRQAVAS